MESPQDQRKAYKRRQTMGAWLAWGLVIGIALAVAGASIFQAQAGMPMDPAEGGFELVRVEDSLTLAPESDALEPPAAPAPQLAPTPAPIEDKGGVCRTDGCFYYLARWVWYDDPRASGFDGPIWGAPAIADDTAHLLKAQHGVWNGTEDEGCRRRIEGIVAERHLLGVRLHQVHLFAQASRPACGPPEHPRTEVDGHDARALRMVGHVLACAHAYLKNCAPTHFPPEPLTEPLECHQLNRSLEQVEEICLPIVALLGTGGLAEATVQPRFGAVAPQAHTVADGAEGEDAAASEGQKEKGEQRRRGGRA